MQLNQGVITVVYAVRKCSYFAINYKPPPPKEKTPTGAETIPGDSKQCCRRAITARELSEGSGGEAAHQDQGLAFLFHPREENLNRRRRRMRLEKSEAGG